MTAKLNKTTMTVQPVSIRIEAGHQVDIITLAMLQEYKTIWMPLMFREGLMYLTIQLQTKAEAIRLPKRALYVARSRVRK